MLHFSVFLLTLNSAKRQVRSSDSTKVQGMKVRALVERRRDSQLCEGLRPIPCELVVGTIIS